VFCEPRPRAALPIAELPADFVERRSQAASVPRVDRADRNIEQLRNFLDGEDALRLTVGGFVRLLHISWRLVGWRALSLGQDQSMVIDRPYGSPLVALPAWTNNDTEPMPFAITTPWSSDPR
jgi:hypothetical protein